MTDTKHTDSVEVAIEETDCELYEHIPESYDIAFWRCKVCGKELYFDTLDSLHHQLQKARQDWLREEIVKLEGMKTSFVPADSEWFGDENYDKGEWKLVPAKDPAKAMYCLTCERFLPEEGCTCGTVQIQTIIDRYQAELDPVHDFFTAPEEVQRPVYERALQKAQEEQEKITNNQTL